MIIGCVLSLMSTHIVDPAVKRALFQDADIAMVRTFLKHQM